MSSTVAIEREPEQTYLEPIIAWRTWRILEFETLSGESTYRLCAVGTHGIPKVWEPRKGTVAVCSSYKSNHEAPWPDHCCGLYGFRSREETEANLKLWVETQSGEKAGWALGRVSMWGRIVECERGWRAQYAYPYDLVVYGDESLARAIRNLYAVDVETRPALLASEPEEKEPAGLSVEEREEKLREIAEELRRIEASTHARSTSSPTLEETLRREEKEWEERRRADPLWCVSSNIVGQVQIRSALFQAINARDEQLRAEGKRREGIATARDVAAVFSPDFATEHAAQIGSWLWSLECQGFASRIRLRDHSGQFWVPAYRLDKVRKALGDRVVEPPQRDHLAEPTDPEPREILRALEKAIAADGDSGELVLFRSVQPHALCESIAVVAQRLNHLRRYGFVRSDDDAGIRRWGLTPEGRAALA